MAKMIGRTSSWLYWVAGLICALVFGKATYGGEQLQADYGIRQRPRPIEQPAANPEDVKKAEQIVAEYLAPAAAAPGPEQKAAAEKLIKDFGSPDFKTREDASTAIVKLGQAALGQLRESAKSKDPEVSSRSETAIKVIEDSLRSGTAEELKKLGSAGQGVVTRQMNDAFTARAKAQQAVDLAKVEGKNDEAARLGKELDAASARAQALQSLFRLVVPQRNIPTPVYGIRPVLE